MSKVQQGPMMPDQPLYVRDVTHPDGECPLHGTKGDCACTDTGLYGPKDYEAARRDAGRPAMSDCWYLAGCVHAGACGTVGRCLDWPAATVDMDCPDRNHPMHNAGFCLLCATDEAT